MIEIIGGVLIAVMLFVLWQGVNILPFVFLGGLLYLLYRFSSGKIPQLNNNIGNINHPLTNINFEQIGGQEAAKKELLEALDFIRKPSLIRQMGIRPLKGILLVGPPGTGKTLLARAAACYTNSIFISVAGSEFIEMYAGVGAQRVRQIFNQCRQRAQSQKKDSAVLFIDEIDILGGKRGTHTSHQEYEQTLNQLLVEMDGINPKTNPGILVIGATNRPESLDHALMRPGRFDRVVQVELPDMEGRHAILKLHTRNKPLTKEVDLEKVARETFGFSGAHLESLANEAAILAMREGCKSVSESHFMDAIDKVMMGEKNDRKPDRSELWRIALHECGHALVGELIKPGSVSVITITPRGKSLGYIRHHPERDQYIFTREYLEGQICILLGGAVTEKIILGEQSTGSANDFNQAVEVARKIIGAGLSSLGVVCAKDLSPNLMTRTVRRIISKQEERVSRLLTPYVWLINEAATFLMEKEKITGEYIRNKLSAAKNAPTDNGAAPKPLLSANQIT